MSTSLERQYERLLALFPAAHRHEYQDEMLGVLLAGARPGQRLPRLSEAANLVLCALWLRLGGRGGPAPDQRWHAAAAAYGLLASMVLLTVQLRALGDGPFLWWHIIDQPLRLTLGQWVLTAGWALVVAAAFTRVRLLAPVLALGVAGCQAAAVFGRYLSEPETLVERWPSLVFAGSAALALVLAARGGVRGQDVLGRSRTTAAVLALLVLAVLPAVEVLLAEVHRLPEGVVGYGAWGGRNVSGMYGDFGVRGVISMVFEPLGGLALLLVTLVGIPAPLRRRLLVLAAPLLLILIAVPPVFNGFLVSTVRFHPPVLLEAGQWVFLLGAPLLVFIAGVLLVERGERRAYLVGLGLAAERAARVAHPATAA
ncbi:hypothetical protein Cs7R123_53490 [Catellatospora sp. TT07R-123]|uniref:hypothetical protein n=1 Tax=Catellatospora sp. TT07R-123 TaxID=2733863 RepID=UPI001B030B9C|nr:hypothetical protein [Catellatospora sp. TT07R-123]GHJ48007.1 hypothetical protein Cs7R123_53490 [Catellatospora sp. TT07R-123]